MDSHDFSRFRGESGKNLIRPPPPKLCASRRSAMARTLRKSMKMDRSEPRGGATSGARLAAAANQRFGLRTVRRVPAASRGARIFAGFEARTGVSLQKFLHEGALRGPRSAISALPRSAMARTLRKSMKMDRSVLRGGAYFGARLAAAEMYVDRKLQSEMCPEGPQLRLGCPFDSQRCVQGCMCTGQKAG